MHRRILFGVAAWLLGAATATAGSLLAVSLLGQGITGSSGQLLTQDAVNRALASEAAEAPAIHRRRRERRRPAAGGHRPGCARRPATRLHGAPAAGRPPSPRTARQRRRHGAHLGGRRGGGQLPGRRAPT